MNEDLKRLYGRICDYSLDEPGSRFTFSQRLARENGWTADYVERVIEEYKKFMFLAVAAGHPVTPSDQVDQVWHLHLVYTQSYWRGLCGEVLGRQVHHGPTKGGAREKNKYRDWYLRTQASYRRLLKVDPPADIWPDVDVRFGEDLKWVRVNMGRNWIIPKPLCKRWLLVGLSSIILLVLVVVALQVMEQKVSAKRDGPLEVTLCGTVSDTENSQAGSDLNLSVAAANHRDGHRQETLWRQASAGPRSSVSSSSDGAVETALVVFAIVLVVGILIVHHILFGNSCSKCGRAHAMAKTGKERDEGAETQYESLCKFCGATVWQEEQTSDGGCGGCGCGGCGGCGG